MIATKSSRKLVVEACAGGEVDTASVHELLALLLRRVHVRVRVQVLDVVIP